MFSADLSWTDQRAETVGQRRERRLRSHRDHGSSTQSFQSDDSASRSSFWSLPVRRKNNPSKSPALNSPSRKSSKLSLSRPREDSLDSAASWSTPAPLPTPVLPALPSIASVDTVQEQRSPRHSTTRSSGKSSAYRTSPDVGPKCTWEAPADWDIASIRSFSQNRQSFESSFLCDPDAAELTQFQRFVRRMERADPKLILTRLKDEPSPDDLATDPYAEEELAVEKHLWCLTALQLQNMENSLVPNQGVGPLLGLPTLFRQPKRVLELYSNLAEVYQLSAIYPKSHISYLTVRKPLASIPLPANIHPLTVPCGGILPFPYPTDSFNHIRCAALPSHLPSSKIQPVLRDLLRMLAPGGILELRLVDSTPVRATMGPRLRAWFEDRLLLNLEKEFLCSRPMALLPGWVRDCGFSVLEGGARGKDLVVQRLRLPACAHPKDSERRHSIQKASMQDGTKRSTLDYNKRNAMTGSGTEAMDFAAPVEKSTGPDSDSTALDGELATLVARGLWKDSWGSLVDRGSTLGHDVIWWWDDPEIVRECWDYGTVFECGTMFAFKE
ncbi:hypothetical protein SLS55_002706 [Diplodia seriata]|uniref:Methyltransferase type 11 domain-containing protein n=1 Tax=Diplodia seriata TaxID=420778 RepID=A0ABR3CSX7_9PEZI